MQQTLLSVQILFCEWVNASFGTGNLGQSAATGLCVCVCVLYLVLFFVFLLDFSVSFPRQSRVLVIFAGLPWGRNFYPHTHGRPGYLNYLLT